MKPLAPNTLLQNRYLIVQLIGKGGMGEVYLAVDQRLGSAIALKRMLFSDEESLNQAFEREAKMLARLRHPALTKVSDHFTENEMQYLVMEHISGDDLSKRLELNQKPFPLSWVLFWADQLLDALAYLHSHEPPIIHRDIKPQNLKLTNENHIILLDFGLAKNSGGETRLSTTGDVVAYTPNYASMEQIRGTGTTARSDIYSLCATMYQLLTNIVPADALTRADSVLNSLPDPIRPLNELNPEVSPAIAKVIMKGMSLSSEQRYANAKETQMALREAYSQVQQGMSADTVAFNAAEKNQILAPVVQADLKTEQFSVPNFSQPVGEKTEVMPMGLNAKTSENIAANITEPPPNFDATIPFVEAPVIAPNIKETKEYPQPVGEKTEVMPMDISGAFGEKTEVSPLNYVNSVNDKTEAFSMDFSAPVGEKTEVFPMDIATPNQTESFYPQDTSNEPQSYHPEATIPLVNLGEHVSELPSQATATNFVAPPPNDLTGNYQAEEISQPIQEEVKAEPKKKAAGGGKMFAILGVLALLAFLGIGAAGIGAYVFMPELFISATPTPSPTAEPTPEPSLTPSVSPTPEPTVEESNTNTGNSSSNLSNTNTENANVNANVETTKPEGEGDKTPRPQGDKTPQPTPGRQGTPPKPTPPKPTPPKPTPSKTPDRTRIL